MSAESWKTIRHRVRAGSGDALVLVWGGRDDVETACSEIAIRAREATAGVPSETRQALKDQTNGFERILPGPDRVYPDTDSPPTRVTRERVEGLQARLAARPWDREARYAAVGVPRNTSHFLIRRGGAALVDHVVSECGADLRFAAFLFGEHLKGLRRAGTTVEELSREDWDHNVQEDYVTFWFRNLDYLLHRTEEAPDRQILAGWREPTAGLDDGAVAATLAEPRFRFQGYELLDIHGLEGELP